MGKRKETAEERTRRLVLEPVEQMINGAYARTLNEGAAYLCQIGFDLELGEKAAREALRGKVDFLWAPAWWEDMKQIIESKGR